LWKSTITGVKEYHNSGSGGGGVKSGKLEREVVIKEEQEM